ncbi:putative leucine-rich repeat-containing protein DDB_G0290503 [Sitophilus oryzae]|uniref:Leucine-rich repeat-containing protein DDB_G0290503 n=1 Tax=Sitophilus oryzae TaxID=7048 RepID=A0A6J2XGR6_SITOR|nr:putative leucine-rich repeat-containing protein DDB_G0290503 [Sitophilus oryzae]
MDNPGISLFQGADININNSQNNEEEEDLEDQIRRKEELQNLIQANLDDFKYDDSTINSSANISLASVDNFEQTYKDAITPNEQLQVLYQVRVREIQSLKEEFNKHKEKSKEEIDSLKHKNILLEAELRQTKVSLSNAEVLLVEKTQTINNLTNNLAERDKKIEHLTAILKENETELATYKSELTELELKLSSQKGPFNLNAKFISEEYRKSLQEKISKLETCLEKERQKSEQWIKEREVLQEELQRLVVEKLDLEKDNGAILINFNSAQSQCKDLISLIESLQKENKHFKERIRQLGENGSQNFDFDVSSGHNTTHQEKLKKMLLDKSIELDTLNTKLRCYEQDAKELLEYRQLKADIYNKDFQKCDNSSHTKDLLILQNDLQNYRRIIDDKDQQILTLNLNNTDLKEKIEEMLLQTRNEIQNISFKYNVPKLEVMSKELEKAEDTVKELSEKLEESEIQRLSLLKKLQSNTEKNETEIKNELVMCQDELKETLKLLEIEKNTNRDIFKELECTKNEVMNLKTKMEELKIKNQKLEENIKNSNKNEKKLEDDSLKKEYEQLKDQLKQVMQHLEKSNIKSNQKESSSVVKEIKHQMDLFLINLENDIVEKGVLEEQICSWKKLLDDIVAKEPDEVLKSHYKEALINLHSSNKKLKELENAVLELKSTVAVVENEKLRLSSELNDNVKRLENAERLCKKLELEIDELKMLKVAYDEQCQNIDDLNHQLGETISNLQSKETELKARKDKMIQIEQEKMEMKKWFDKLKPEMDKLRNENIKLHNELKKEQNKGKKTLKTTGTQVSLENGRHSSKNKENECDINNKLMNAELKLRDEIQIEYQKRINEIEKRYKNMCKDVKEVSKQYEDKLEQQEKQYKEYLKMILKECEKCTKETESEKLDLTTQLKSLKEEFDNYKSSVLGNEEKYVKLLKQMEKVSEKKVEAWRKWSKKVVTSCLDIEATNKKVRDKVLTNLKAYDQEIAEIQKAFDAKMEKKKSSKKRSID